MDFVQRHTKSENDRKFMCMLLARTIPDLNSLEEIEDMLRLLGGTIKHTRGLDGYNNSGRDFLELILKKENVQKMLDDETY
jgi:hypothetical protein